MHADLQDAVDFHDAIIAEGGKALVGYEREKALANMVLLAEIPTTYDQEEQRQVNAGNLLLRGVPGVGKTFFGVILAAISGARFARLQGRADLQPTEVVGFQMINPATGEFMTEFGPLASAEVILLDEINRIPLKSQSAFLEGLQDRSVTVGKETYRLPAFSFAIATMNPIELGQGTFPLSEAATDRFAIMVNIGYLPPEEEQKLVAFDFKKVHLDGLMPKARVLELRARIGEQVFLHEALGKYIRRLVSATRPYSPETEWRQHSPSPLVEQFVDLGGSPRATICWGRLVKVWALLAGRRAEVYPEDVQALAPYVLGHRIWLAPHAAGRGVRVDDVIASDIAVGRSDTDSMNAHAEGPFNATSTPDQDVGVAAGRSGPMNAQPRPVPADAPRGEPGPGGRRRRPGARASTPATRSCRGRRYGTSSSSSGGACRI